MEMHPVAKMSEIMGNGFTVMIIHFGAVCKVFLRRYFAGEIGRF
jgi:hypothetical protein